MKDSKWQGQSRGGRQGNLFFVMLLRYAGINAAYLFLCLIIPYFLLFAPKATQAIWDFYRNRMRYGLLKSIFALPAHYYKFGQVLIDKTAIGMGLQDRYRFKFNNYHLFEEADKSQKGLMIIGAHVGNWECGAQFFNGLDRRVNIIMLDAEHRKIKEVIEKNSQEASYNIIPLGGDMISSIIEIKCALGRNEIICTQGDRYMASKEDGSSHTHELEFFGTKAHFPQGPFMIARKFKVPVLFFFALRSGHKEYTFNFYKPQEDIPLYDSYVPILEETVRKNPSQWFNFYKFW